MYYFKRFLYTLFSS